MSRPFLTFFYPCDHLEEMIGTMAHHMGFTDVPIGDAGLTFKDEDRCALTGAVKSRFKELLMQAVEEDVDTIETDSPSPELDIVAKPYFTELASQLLEREPLKYFLSHDMAVSFDDRLTYITISVPVE